MEKQPEPAEVDAARERAVADARAKVERDREQPPSDAPVVESSGPYEFAPETLRAEYDRAYEDALAELEGEG